MLFVDNTHKVLFMADGIGSRFPIQDNPVVNLLREIDAEDKVSTGEIKPQSNTSPVDDGDDHPFHAEDNFADDAVAAQVRSRQQAQEKQSTDRAKNNAADKLRVQDQEIASTSGSSQTSTGQDPNLSEAERMLRDGALQQAKAPVMQEVVNESQLRAELRIALGVEEMASLMRQIDLLGGADAIDQALRMASETGKGRALNSLENSGRLAGNVVKLLQLNEKMLAAEGRVRAQLRDLLAGTLGFALFGDPRSTFRRLLARIQNWPKRIRPGRHPQTPEDFDSLIAWIYEPPAVSREDTEIFEELSKGG